MATGVEVAARNLLRRFGVEAVPTKRGWGGPSLLGWHLHRLFDVLDIDVVFDVGARVGEYATWLRQNGYRGRIVSFEPVAASLEQLRSAAMGDPKWEVKGYALGAVTTEAEINVTADSHFSSLLSSSDYGIGKFGRHVAIGHRELVSVRRLDDVWDDLPEGRIYLKLDTQGFDLQVLKGAGDKLANVVALQTEAAVQIIYDGAPTHLETMSVLNSFGFAPSGMFPVTLDDSMRLVEYDLVAVRR